MPSMSHQEAVTDREGKELKYISLGMEAERYEQIREVCSIMNISIEKLFQDALLDRLKLIYKALIYNLNGTLPEDLESADQDDPDPEKW